MNLNPDGKTFEFDEDYDDCQVYELDIWNKAKGCWWPVGGRGTPTEILSRLEAAPRIIDAVRVAQDRLAEAHAELHAVLLWAESEMAKEPPDMVKHLVNIVP